VDYDAQPRLRERYRDQADVLLNTAAAARLVGGTPLDRPEDIKVHPLDGSVYVTLTNNTSHGNFWGQILRLEEQDGDHAALRFTWDYFAVGGPAAGFASPDNLQFDREGGLWMCSDISSSRLGRAPYAAFPNNGVYYFPTVGAEGNKAFQFASAPVQAETTGPCFTPDEQTLFLSIQHPGEETRAQGEYTSHWPDGGREMPRSAVVAITGF
jgi:secreted PhoX family phosphatase